VDDCNLLVESNLCPPLKPIQRRKLLNAWKMSKLDQLSIPGQCSSAVEKPAEITLRSPSSSPSTRTYAVSAGPSQNTDENWVQSFQVPWRKCADEMVISYFSL